MKRFLVPILFILVGVGCFLGFSFTGQSIDANGILHENFALMATGILLTMIGLIIGVVKLFTGKKKDK